MGNMGFYQPEWNNNNFCLKQKHRWRFIIPSVCGDGISSLPPMKSGRPSIQFKEMATEHLNETIYFPSKPDWKPIQLTLYDIVKPDENPVFTWIKRIYDPKNCSYWQPALSAGFKCAECYLVLYDGCGEEIERWVFEHAWPQQAEFAEGDMTSGEIMTCDLTLRYDRAYIKTPSTSPILTFDTTLINNICSVTPAISMIDFDLVPIPEFMMAIDQES